ncbi:MAG: transporter substrate-binding domain-containing protein [Pseudomonadota bacterium]
MKAIFLAVVLAAGLSGPAAADVIELRAGPWCPYTCDPAGERPGVLVELAREALAPFGHQVNYETLNWARSLKQVERGDIDGVIGIVPAEAPSLIQGPPMAPFVHAIAWRRGEARAVSSPQHLAGLTVGAINGYAYLGPVRAYIDANRNDRARVQFTSGEDALTRNLQKLAARRVDLVPDVRAVLEYALATTPRGPQFSIVDMSWGQHVSIAFSPRRGRSKTYAGQLSEGLKTLQASGRYHEILAAYGLSTPVD